MRSARALQLVLGLVLLPLASCLAIPPASERATDAARELNIAARFGRMDIAMGLTSGAARKNFLKHRSAWGGDVRIVDVELASMNMRDGDHAEIHVDYSWTRVDEGVLRTTRVAQNWEDVGGGWKLVRERRLQGDLGLFGEPRPAPSSEPRPDVHFATKTIE